MKNLVRAALYLVFVGLSSRQAGAAWAGHSIVSRGNPSTKYPVAVASTEDKNRVQIFIPVKNDEGGLAYFVIRAKERLPGNELEFRMSMSRWRHYQEFLKKGQDARFQANPARKADWEKFYADVERFEEMSRIEPETRDGVRGIFLELGKSAALRTYVVHDFLPWGGLSMRDGGLWLTYDIPSFVDAFVSKGKSEKSGKKAGDQFRIRNVLFEAEKEGSRTFRVQVEKLSKGQPNLRDLGIRLRIWERTPDGGLLLVEPENRAEWDMVSPVWKDGEIKDLVLTWKGPGPGGGNVYHGFSADVIYANNLQHSWSTSPELLTHLLAVEPLDTHSSRDLKYGFRPERIFHEARRKLAGVSREVRTENRASDVETVKGILQTLEMLATRYPEMKPDDVLHYQRQARKMLDEWARE